MHTKYTFLLSLFLLVSPAYADEFIPEVAASDAAKISDKDKTSLYLTVVPANAKEGPTIAVLAKKIIAAAKAKANLAVIGPDADLTARLLFVALQVASKESLEGATILYVGDAEQASLLEMAAMESGAIIRATDYSGK